MPRTRVIRFDQIVDEITRQTEDLLHEATEFATNLAATTSPVAVAMTRQMLWSFSGGSADALETHHLESKNLCHMLLQGDGDEGVASLLEKRPPSFPMRVSSDMPAWHKHTVQPTQHRPREEGSQ